MGSLSKNVVSVVACVLALSACATLTESNQQVVLVQTVAANREVLGVGCVLSNKAGRWFVNTPGRVTIRKSVGDLEIDCKKEGVGAGGEKIASKMNTSLWGNLIISAGLGYFVDRNTGAGFDYPDTLTVIMQAPRQSTAPPPANGAPALF